MKLDNYIADKYARILTKENVSELFDTLTKRLQGNRSEATRQCGLTGKATYDWEKAGYVKLDTKRKVLEACLRIDFLDTIEYLLSRSSERTVDILRTILSTIYAEAIETDSKEQFGAQLNKFDMLKMKYRGLIRDQIEEEAADMTWLLSKKASELQIPLRQRLIKDFSTQELLESIRLTGDIYTENPTEAERFAKEDLNLPTETLRIILPIFRELSSIRKVKAEAVTETGGLGETVVPTSMLSWAGGVPPTDEYLSKIDEKKTEMPIVT